MPTLNGFDVSEYQGTIDWAAVAGAGIAFAYLKATEGLSITDAQFSRNLRTSNERNIPRGAYHFFHFNDDPEKQADFFLAAAKPRAGDLPPAVDVETTDGITGIAQLVDTLSRFVTRVESKLGGKRMVIYTAMAFWNEQMQGSDAFSGHPLWIAEYNADKAPTLPNGWNDWLIWQHADNGTLPGITGAVDLDVFQGDIAHLKSLTLKV